MNARCFQCSSVLEKSLEVASSGGLDAWIALASECLWTGEWLCVWLTGWTPRAGRVLQGAS